MVSAIDLNEIGTTTLSTKVQTRCRSWSDWTTCVTTHRRGCKSERQIVAFVNWQIVDALLIDSCRDGSLRCLYYLRSGVGDRHAFRDLSGFKRNIECCCLAYSQVDL